MFTAQWVFEGGPLQSSPPSLSARGPCWTQGRGSTGRKDIDKRPNMEFQTTPVRTPITLWGCTLIRPREGACTCILSKYTFTNEGKFVLNHQSFSCDSLLEPPQGPLGVLEPHFEHHRYTWGKTVQLLTWMMSYYRPHWVCHGNHFAMFGWSTAIGFPDWPTQPIGFTELCIFWSATASI